MALYTFNDNFQINAPKHIDTRYLNLYTPYTNAAQANSLIPMAYRYLGLTVLIGTIEWWYQTGITDPDLIPKIVGGGGSLVDADNGLIVAGGTTVELGAASGPGSPLLRDSFIDGGANFKLKVNSNSTTSNAFEVEQQGTTSAILATNSSGTSGNAISAVAGNGATGVNITSTTGKGINIVSSGGSAAYLTNSGTGVGIQCIISGSGEPLHISSGTAPSYLLMAASTNNDVKTVLKLARQDAVNPGAANIGGAIEFLNESTDSVIRRSNRIISELLTATASAENSQVRITGVNAGSEVDKITIGPSATSMIATRFETAQGSTATAANDLVLGTDGNLFSVSGSTQINAITIANWQAGSEIGLIIVNSPTFKNNTAGGAGTAKMLLSGGTDYTAAINDYIAFRYDGTVWHETTRNKATSGGSYTFSNGITESPATQVKLGGTLTADTTITNAGNLLTMTSSSGFKSVLALTNTQSSAVNPVLIVTATGATNVCIDAETDDGVALYANATGAGTGIQAFSDTGYAGLFETFSTTLPAIIAISTPAPNNTVAPYLSLVRNAVTASAAPGLGGSIDCTIKVANGDLQIANQIISQWTDAIEATRTSEFSIVGLNSAVSATLLTLSGNGQLKLNKYGSGTFTGTPTKVLEVDASGNIIEGNLTSVNPASPDTSVQFNNSGAFGGSSNFTWDNSNTQLNVNIPAPSGQKYYLNIGTSPSGLGRNQHIGLAIKTNASTAQYSFGGIDFIVPTTGTVGSFLFHASNYVGSGSNNFIQPNAVGLLGYSNQLYYFLNASTGYISFAIGVSAPAEKLRLNYTGNLNLGSTLTDTASALFKMTSTTQGFLEPVMTTTQKNAIASPVLGLQVYDSTVNAPYYYDGTTWRTSGQIITAISNTFTITSGTLSLNVSATAGNSIVLNSDGVYAPTITADNGLTKTTNNIQLGGTLLQNTTIDGSTSYSLTVTSAAPTTLSVVNTNASGIAASLNLTPSSTNTTVPILKLERLSSGTAAANIGESIDFYLQSNTGTSRLAHQIKSSWATATDASRSSTFIISNVLGAVTQDVFQISATGLTVLSKYGTGTFTGTATKSLQVTSAGQIIEGPIEVSTANNGLSKDVASNVQLGGLLVHDTTIDHTATYQLNFINSPVISIGTSSAQVDKVLYVTDTTSSLTYLAFFNKTTALSNSNNLATTESFLQMTGTTFTGTLAGNHTDGIDGQLWMNYSGTVALEPSISTSYAGIYGAVIRAGAGNYSGNVLAGGYFGGYAASSGNASDVAGILVQGLQSCPLAYGASYSGTVTNYYGILVQNVATSSLASSVTNKYGIYIKGASSLLNVAETAFTTPSDRRIKKNIKTSKYGLKELLQIETKEFTYIDDSIGNDPQIGFIAQDVEKVIPEAVKTRNLYGHEDFKLLDKDVVFAVMLNAIKELSAEIELLKKNK